MTLRSLLLITACSGALATQMAQAEDWIPSYSLYGTPGLIEMPTARALPDGQMSATVSNLATHTRTSLTFQVTPRLTGTFRYTRMPNLDFNTPTYFDRSLDLQYRLLDESDWRPAVAIGLRDFLGTGASSSEYVVASKTFGPRLQVTGGLGWGQMGARNGFSNPLASLFGDGLRDREPFEFDASTGGTIKDGQLFHGDAAFFGGIEYTLTDSIRLMAEYSSDMYQVVQPGNAQGHLFEQRSPFSFGVNYSPRPSMQFGAYYVNGAELGVSATFIIDPQSPYAIAGVDTVPLPVGQPNAAAASSWQAGPAYDSTIIAPLSFAMEEQGLILRGVETQGQTMRVRYENPRFRSEAQAMGRAARILSQLAPAGVTTFMLEPETHGVPKSQLVVGRADLVALENELGAAAQLRDRVIVRDAGDSAALTEAPSDAPRFGWAIAPYFGYTLFGAGERLQYQVGLSATASYDLAPNLFLEGQIRQRIAGNEERAELTDPAPDETDVPVVRRDVGNYMLSTSPELHHLTLTHYGRLTPDVYTRVTGGYLERMYGGVSGELLWKPADSRFGLGAEITYAVKRDESGLGFQDYETTTGFVSAYYEFNGDFVARLDVGRFLAGDWGGTLSLEREFPNGWRVGGYVTVTDMPYDDYGEGSFDKGLLVTVPVDWLIGVPTREIRSTRLQSLTRDGGQRVDLGDGLYSMIRDAHEKDLDDSWGRFWK